MDTILIAIVTLLYFVSLAYIGKYVCELIEEVHFWRRESHAASERQNTAKYIVMETYKRLYYTDKSYIDKEEALTCLLYLMNVYGIGCCKDALEKSAERQPEATDDDSTGGR